MANKTLQVHQTGTKSASTKKAVNFLCDSELFKEFKLYCTRNGLTMTSVLEDAMTQIINSEQQ